MAIGRAKAIGANVRTATVIANSVSALASKLELAKQLHTCGTGEFVIAFSHIAHVPGDNREAEKGDS